MLDMKSLVKAALGLCLVACVYYAYFVQIVNPYHDTTYVWLVSHWSNVSNYSHGPLIPVIALGLVWWKHRELMAAPVRPVSWGAGIVALAMLTYYLGVKGGQERVIVISFILLLYGLALTFGGREVFRVLFFPITFLWLMIPLNFLDQAVGFPLRTFVAIASTALLNWFGILTTRVGTGIYETMPAAFGMHASVFSFDVADPCSGIRSLMALSTVTAAYAYVTQREQWKRWALFLSAMPLAVLGNMARVTSIGLVAHVYGQELAAKTYHECSGYIVFAVALSAMVVFGLLLNFPYHRVWENWMKPPEPRGEHE